MPKSKKKHTRLHTYAARAQKKHNIIPALIIIAIIVVAILVFKSNTENVPLQPTTSVVTQNISAEVQSPVLNITMNATNALLADNSRYWAIANYTRQVTAWILASSTVNSTKAFTANISMEGIWHTSAGLASPANSAIIEPSNGSGTFLTTYQATIYGIENSSLPHTGFIGSYDLGGNLTDISINTITSIGGSNSLNWMYMVFGSNAVLGGISNYDSVFHYKNQTFKILLNNNTVNESGNIVT